MKKHVVAASIGLLFGVVGDVNAGAISFAPTGTGPGLLVGGFDWGPTSFLAQGSNTAIVGFLTPGGNPNFQVYTAASLITISDPKGNVYDLPSLGLPSLETDFEITLVMGFQAAITGVDFVNNSISFTTVPNPAAAFLRIYYDAAPNSNDLQGFGFNDGRLIASSDSINVATGAFTIFDTTLGALDQFGNDEYPGQLSVASGFGSTDSIVFSKFNGSGAGGIDSSFFTNYVGTDGRALSLTFDNVSQVLPFFAVNPSDCFTAVPQGALGVTDKSVYACDSSHDSTGPYLVQTALPGGIVPNVGAIDGVAATGGTDFVAQTDFNSSADTPEPGSIALIGAGLGALAMAGRRRRVAKKM